MYFFSYLEPVCCSMSSSSCCFLTCIQISQEAGLVVWYSHLFQSFPQFIVIHTVKGFSIVNKAEIDVFLELSCFFYDPMDVCNLISGSSAFSKTSLNIRKFTLHVLLKPGLENFEHYFTSMWDECNCAVVWAFGMKTDLFQSSGHCWVFQICWHIECFLLVTKNDALSTDTSDKSGSVQFSTVAQSCPTLATPWTAAHQAYLSVTNSRNLLKLMSIESVMPSGHLILCRPLLLLLSISPNDSVLHIRWPKYWSFIFNISPSSEYSGLISFRIDWPNQSKGLSGVFSNTTVQKRHQFFGAQLCKWSNTHTHKWRQKKPISLTKRTFVGKVMSLFFNILSRLVITFLPRSMHLLISWLQSPSAVILEPQNCFCSPCSHLFFWKIPKACLLMQDAWSSHGKTVLKLTWLCWIPTNSCLILYKAGLENVTHLLQWTHNLGRSLVFSFKCNFFSQCLILWSFPFFKEAL